jgi:flagellar protein FlaF
MDALDWNRRVWSALSIDCSSSDNGLPAMLRANIISLAIFVSKYTSQVMREDEDIQDLIDINRLIMQGLSGE